eukprot:189233-Pelagomonas_calceolata.AAC.1
MDNEGLVEKSANERCCRIWHCFFRLAVNRWLGSRMLHGHNVSLLAWSGTAAEQSPRTQRRCPLLVRSLSACGCNGRQTRWPQRLQWTVQPFVHCCASVPKLEFCRLLKAKLCRDIS